MSTYYTHTDSPVGTLLLVASDSALIMLHIVAGKYVPTVGANWIARAEHPLLARAIAELGEYFAGTRRDFRVPLAPQGTPFQQRVWHALCRIPFGETRSYLQQAKMLGEPGAVRAVGAANGRNPIGIIIPCHRVIGADGSLTGYAGGLAQKEFLLRHEGALPGARQAQLALA